MVVSELDDYAYLWDGSEAGWCLVRVGADQSEGTEGFVIHNQRNSLVLIIEDDELYERVIRRMLTERCPIVSSSELSDAGHGKAPDTAV